MARKSTPAQEVARDIRRAALTFRLSLTDILAGMDVSYKAFEAWEKALRDMTLTEYLQVTEVLDALRHDPKRQAELETEAIYRADWPLRRRTVERPLARKRLG